MPLDGDLSMVRLPSHLQALWRVLLQPEMYLDGDLSTVRLQGPSRLHVFWRVLLQPEMHLEGDLSTVRLQGPSRLQAHWRAYGFHRSVALASFCTWRAVSTVEDSSRDA
mmetsp:Transcript_177959/g.564773  ORF Transcript_177959/g.564773 Transcript_177959/m.564773 type:complete len:109 (+) Transcript_177959:2913-3239(+)